MPTTRVRILQLGDVHFPESSDEKPSIDAKDSAFPADIRGLIAGKPFQTVIRRISSLVDDGDCDAILLMGDLTSYGKKSDYEKCLNFLADAIWDRVPPQIDRARILIAAGNHDVNRDDAKSTDVAEKFRYMNDCLRRCGLGEVIVDGCQNCVIQKDRGEINIIGINTSIGCGVLRALPDRARSAVQSIYDAALMHGAGVDPKIWHELYETLDAPMITEDTIRVLQQKISLSEGVSVIFGHHNLLPQVLPRMAPYAEFVNSGVLRQTMLSTERVLLYLHGHIHDDPIEIVSSPYHDRARVVAISAPELRVGYNLLIFDFDSVGRPLGCLVEQHRYKDGVITVVRRTELPLLDHLADGASHAERQLLSAVERSSPLYWGDAERECKISSDELEEAAVSLMWRRRLVLDRRSAQRDRWLVRRPS
jgi:hypothetical protein